MEKVYEVMYMGVEIKELLKCLKDGVYKFEVVVIKGKCYVSKMEVIE